MGRLEGRTAVITGAGQGVGAAAAKRFAREGAAVVVNDIEGEPAMQVAAEIQAEGGKALAVVGDITDPLFPDQLVTTTIEAFQSFEILIHNAGYNWDGMLHNTTDEQMRAMLAIHFEAPFRLTRTAVPKMLEARRNELRRHQGNERFCTARKIIFVSSIAGLYGNIGQSAYAGAKSAMLGLAKSVAKEYGPQNILSNCVVLGPIDTRLTKEKGQAPTIERNGHAILLGVPVELLQRVHNEGPLRRLGTPEEAAGALLFLASDDANFVTGAVLEVTGGFTS